MYQPLLFTPKSGRADRNQPSIEESIAAVESSETSPELTESEEQKEAQRQSLPQ